MKVYNKGVREYLYNLFEYLNHQMEQGKYVLQHDGKYYTEIEYSEDDYGNITLTLVNKRERFIIFCDEYDGEKNLADLISAYRDRFLLMKSIPVDSRNLKNNERHYIPKRRKKLSDV